MTPSPPRAPRRIGRLTRAQWLGVAVVLILLAAFAVAMVVLAARVVASLPAVQDFLRDHPGTYALPAAAPVGIPPWLAWQHFFDVLLLVLVARTGWQARRESRPRAFWSPRRDRRRRTSLTIWLHQALDAVWVANGVVYVVLLFATGQWMRIVPTSWSVLPNAVSAVLQYATLRWPTENGWVAYNAAQQLAYFAIVFVAAPLAILSGIRLGTLWPRNRPALDRAYPLAWAKRVHFPVMLAFVVVHVALVLSTGALRNLNAMYAAQDSENWVGAGLFALSLAVIAAGWILARPAVVTPIARLFGTVVVR